MPGWRVDIHRQVDLIEEVGRHHGFEHLPTTFPGVQQAPRAVRSAHRARSPRPHRGARHGLLRGHHLRLHRSGGGRALPRRRRAGGAGQPALGEVRRDASEPAARPDRCASATTGATDGATFGCSRSARASPPTGESRGVGPGVDGPGDRRPLERRPARRGLRRHQGRGRAAGGVRRWSMPTFTEADGPYLVPGRAARVVVNGRVVGRFGQLDAAVAERRDLPAGDVVYVAEIDLDALTAAGAGRDVARHAAAALPVGGARRLDSRRRRLVCRDGSWHHSFGCAGHA